MPPRNVFLALHIAMFVLIPGLLASAQDSRPKAAPPSSAEPDAASSSGVGKPAQEWSGMYTFLKEGEFVQLTIENQGQVTGFVSRYGNGESDKGAFLDHFFKSAKLDGNKLIFTTEVVHGVWFDFRGTVERGSGKNSGDEGYYVLKGTLTESSTDANKNVSAQPHEVVFKMFPRNAYLIPIPGQLSAT